MQDAEQDHAFRIGEPACDADHERPEGDDRDAARETRPTHAIAMREIETDADQAEETAGNGARERDPERILGRAEFGEREEAQVPGEVVDRHRRERSAAQHVDQWDPVAGCQARIHVSEKASIAVVMVCPAISRGIGLPESGMPLTAMLASLQPTNRLGMWCLPVA